MGRRRTVTEIRRLIASSRLVTLVGTGGIGKSRLARAAAAVTQSKGTLTGGVWLVDLASVTDPEAVPGVTAAALGVHHVGGKATVPLIAAHLADREALIVLDNCEHVVGTCVALVDGLLSAAPRLRIVITSRRTLRMVGEQVFHVPVLLPDEATDLLVARAVSVRPDFRVWQGNRDAVDRLCAALDRLPLAIELAAARLQTLTVEQLAERLKDRFDLLIRGNGAARPPHRTLRALIDWSYELCSPAERVLWNRMSVFAGDFSLDAAEAVCAGGSLARPHVLNLLDSLVAQSVVATTERDGELRYSLLQTVQAYGRRRLVESGEEMLPLRQHRAYFLALARRTAEGWFGPGQAEALRRLRTEHENFLAALTWDIPSPPQQSGRIGPSVSDPDPPDGQAALALAMELRYHWCAGGALADGRRWLDRLLAAHPEPTLIRAKAVWSVAWVTLLQGDLAQADRRLDEAEALGRRLDDPLTQVQVMGLRGLAAIMGGRLEDAVELLQGAVDGLRALAERPAALFWLFQLAIAKSRLRDPGAAEVGGHAVAEAESLGERHSRSYALWALAFDAFAREDFEQAAALIHSGLQIQRTFNDPFGSAMHVNLLAWIATAGGDHQKAARLQGSTRVMWRRMGTTIFDFGPQLSDFQTRSETANVEALGRAAFEECVAAGSRYDTARRCAELGLELHAGIVPGSVAVSSPLTPREEQVAAWVAEGMGNRQIASILQLSPRTVEGHVKNILGKLGFHSRARIAAWWAAGRESPENALQRGLREAGAPARYQATGRRSTP
ncbi:ATP-binding protein [Streptomyces spongiae]|uniref:ATP-binding protein n=1 Tax=Streptomyces spongiae TaxID=565072 RepID=UPI002AD357EE|nr:LuxR C-terminal-related transcriptional regulator [Streptomyces spongiae]